MERLVRAAPTARGYPADMAKVGSWLLNWVRQPEPIRATRQAGKIQPGTVEGPAALTVAAGRPAGCAERPSGEMESSTRLGMMMSAPPMQAVTTAAMRQPRAVTKAEHRGLNTAPAMPEEDMASPMIRPLWALNQLFSTTGMMTMMQLMPMPAKAPDRYHCHRLSKKYMLPKDRARMAPRAAMTALPPYRKNSREVTPTAAAEARERMV